MANTVEALYSLSLKVTETIDLDSGASTLTTTGANPTFDHQATTTTSSTLNASSAVPATKAWSGLIPLSSGTYTIDLTALTSYSGVSVTFSGLKVQLYKIINKGAATMVFADGAVNGYLLFGDASGQVTLAANQAIMAYLADGAADVDATHKTIDVTGTGAQTFEIVLVAG